MLGVVLAAVGNCVFRFSGSLCNPLGPVLGGIGRTLIVFGFFLTGTLFWGHVSGQVGPSQAWFRAPSFYLTTAFLSVSAFWWFRRPLPTTRRGTARLIGYPVLLILLVIAWQLAVHCLQGSKSASLHAGLQAAQGQAAPEIEFVDANGEERKLSDFKGKVVLLSFWATTCGPCVHEMPGLSELQRKFKERGFVLVYLSAEGPDVLARFFRGRNLDGVHGRMTPDRPVPPFYSPGKAWPTSFLISRTGVVKDNWLGALPVEWTERKIEHEL